MASDQVATTLVLSRKKDWFGMLRAMGVYVDGEKVGSVGRRQPATFEVEPGQHRVQVRMDWCRSEELAVHVLLGTRLEVSCGLRAGGWRWLTNFVGIVLWPHRLFVIEPLEHGQTGSVA